MTAIPTWRIRYSTSPATSVTRLLFGTRIPCGSTRRTGHSRASGFISPPETRCITIRITAQRSRCRAGSNDGVKHSNANYSKEANRCKEESQYPGRRSEAYAYSDVCIDISDERRGLRATVFDERLAIPRTQHSEAGRSRQQSARIRRQFLHLFTRSLRPRRGISEFARTATRRAPHRLARGSAKDPLVSVGARIRRHSRTVYGQGADQR